MGDNPLCDTPAPPAPPSPPATPRPTPPPPSPPSPPSSTREYVVLAPGQACPSGMEMTGYIRCFKAAKALGYPKASGARGSWSDSLSGCLLKDGKVYFNKHTGTKQHSSQRRICKTEHAGKR